MISIKSIWRCWYFTIRKLRKWLSFDEKGRVWILDQIFMFFICVRKRNNTFGFLCFDFHIYFVYYVFIIYFSKLLLFFGFFQTDFGAFFRKFLVFFLWFHIFFVHFKYILNCSSHTCLLNLTFKSQIWQSKVRYFLVFWRSGEEHTGIHLSRSVWISLAKYLNLLLIILQILVIT